MSEAIEHDNTWLIPYLKAVAAAEADGGLDPDDSTEVFGKIYDETPEETRASEFIGASKVRQTMYIAKLARKVSGMLVLTDAGRELIESNPAPVEPEDEPEE